MGKNDRCGNRRKRSEIRKVQKTRLGYYLIVTDTEATEKNYLEGVRKSFPKDMQRNIVIKVIKADTRDLIETCLAEEAKLSQYSECWIVFDRDQVKNFDDIINQANAVGINVGWSNPCIEIWFYAYFGAMPAFFGSVDCCKKFAELFQKKVGTTYKKSDEDIYKKLLKEGDEKKAFCISDKRRNDFFHDCAVKPSEMNPCTTVDLLVREIVRKR